MRESSVALTVWAAVLMRAPSSEFTSIVPSAPALVSLLNSTTTKVRPVMAAIVTLSRSISPTASLVSFFTVFLDSA